MRARMIIALVAGLAAFPGSAPAAEPAVEGQWSGVIAWPHVSIHAALTPSGKVLTIQGDFSSGGDQYLFNPANDSATHVPNPAADLFCAGQAVTADGRILVIGGTSTSGGLGIRDITAFDWQTETWRALAPMQFPRWYATGTTLGDGRVLVTSGYDQPGQIVTTPEIYDVHADSWSDLPAASQSQPIYPFQYQLPDGRVLWAGASEVASETEVLDVATQTWSPIDGTEDGGSIANYAPGKFIKAGSAADSGDPDVPSADTAFTLDMNAPNPTWQPSGNLTVGRSFLNLTNLPDGSVVATGGDRTKRGFDDANGELSAERWDPATGTWTTLASMTEPRLYHSTAVLLPDGRVFVSGGGGDPGVPDHETVEIYSPPYLFTGLPRPTITSAPATVHYGTTATVATPNAASIASVSLIRTGSVTHSFDQNARAMQLAFTAIAGALQVQMPPSGNWAPPGYYMLFVVDDNGVPSIAKMVRFPAPYEAIVPPPPAPPPPPPPPPVVPEPAASATFKTSPKSLRVSKTGRFTYSFTATPLSAGKISLKSTKKVKIGAKKQLLKLAAKSFQTPAAGKVKARFTLSRSKLRALKRIKQLRFAVRVVLEGKVFTAKVTLKRPKRS